MDIRALNTQFWELLEPIALREATNCAIEILNTKYEKADLVLIIAQNCTHLSTSQQEQLLSLTLILEYEEFLDDILGNCQTEAVSFKLKPGTKQHHGKIYPIPQVHLKCEKVVEKYAS